MHNKATSLFVGLSTLLLGYTQWRSLGVWVQPSTTSIRRNNARDSFPFDSLTPGQQNSILAARAQLKARHFYENQQINFYENHYRWMQHLFQNNTRSFLVWGTRSEPEFAHLWQEFDPQDFFNAMEEGAKDPNDGGSHYVWFTGACEAAKYSEKQRANNATRPHVVFFGMNENLGAFSEYIPNKTIDWVQNLTQHWAEFDCTPELIQDYLEHPDTLLAVTMQFQVIDHPKVISLPLGLLEMEEVALIQENALENHNPERFTRKQLLMVNCNTGYPSRDASVRAVLQNFDDTGLHNTYGGSFEEYLKEMERSKFVLAPGGMGFDCYRIWEALLMGTIPVVETLNRTDGWFRTLGDLPVAFIDSYENLTPGWLEKEYQRIVFGEYKYRKLTKQHWVHLIKSHVDELPVTIAA